MQRVCAWPAKARKDVHQHRPVAIITRGIMPGHGMMIGGMLLPPGWMTASAADGDVNTFLVSM